MQSRDGAGSCQPTPVEILREQCWHATQPSEWVQCGSGKAFGSSIIKLQDPTPTPHVSPEDGVQRRVLCKAQQPQEKHRDVGEQTTVHSAAFTRGRLQ
jgi:hypothetical protein